MAEIKKPLDWDQLYPGRFLKAGELLGRKVTLTIQSVDLDELEGEKGKKLQGVVSFTETPRQIPLNKTNGICLREMFGRKLPEWVGKKVTLFEDVCRNPATGENGPCIRVWGSPSLAADKVVAVALHRRKPYMVTLHAPIRSSHGQSSREPGDDGPDGAP